MPEKMMMGDDEAAMDTLYGGSPAGEGAPETGETVDQEEQEETNTAIVPLKVLTGPSTEPLKKGDEVVLKVVEVYGDEAEVAYSTTKPTEIGAGEEKTPEAEIDEMDSGSMGY